MKEKLIRLLKNPYFVITAVYFLAHFFLLILSGCWWDDWTFMTHDTNYVSIVASESGRPEWNLLVPLCWSLPNNGRILIFFLYLGISVFVYVLLKNSSLFDEEESLIIALMFAVFPVDEARILISNFAYTVGYFFFYLSFMLFVIWNRMDSCRKKKIYRVYILILFFISFILNSVLAYYYILFAYLFVLELKRSEEKNLIRKVLFVVKDVLICYPDFFVLPFVYYGFNKTFFPTYGETFGSYNSVTIGGLIKCFLYVPLSIIRVFRNVLEYCASCLNVFTAAILALSVFLVYELSRSTKENQYLRSFIFLIYGLFVMTMAVFPYVMVRGRAIDTIGVKGRDSVLVPLGAAIILYSLISCFKGKIRNTLAVLLITLGIIGFNSLYIEWQKDYYYQLSMQNLMNNEIVRENDTFFITDVNETVVQGERYYSFNVLSYFVYGDETRFFMPKASDMYMLKDKSFIDEAKRVLGASHKMKDYNPDDYCFDAILVYDNDLSWTDVLRIKCYELFNHEKFESVIDQSGTLNIVEVEDDFTEKLIRKYDEGTLHGDRDIIELLLEYSH